MEITLILFFKNIQRKSMIKVEYEIVFDNLI